LKTRIVQLEDESIHGCYKAQVKSFFKWRNFGKYVRYVFVDEPVFEPYYFDTIEEAIESLKESYEKKKPKVVGHLTI
jgi:hypothetical protein